MILQRQLAICLFHLVGGSLCVELKHLVRIDDGRAILVFDIFTFVVDKLIIALVFLVLSAVGSHFESCTVSAMEKQDIARKV